MSTLKTKCQSSIFQIFVLVEHNGAKQRYILLQRRELTKTSIFDHGTLVALFESLTIMCTRGESLSENLAESFVVLWFKFLVVYNFQMLFSSKDDFAL